MQFTIIRCPAAWLLILGICLAGVAEGASPSVDNALKFLPTQEDVDFSRPTAQQAAKCTIHLRKTNGHSSWVVEDPDGLVLRRFADTNGDRVLDQWSYYKDGLEVYRDIDADFNKMVDQHRWFHTGGSRWGIDKDENGEIDAWKIISAEEVTSEVVAALAHRDVNRFARLGLTPDELASLGLGTEKSKEVAEKIGGLAADFKALAARQKIVTSQTKWVQFSGTKPGIVPAGTGGSSKDVRVYENAVAIVQTGETHGQVQIGTLVRAGDAWRVIGAPQAGPDGQAELAASGTFFRASITRHSPATDVGNGEKSQALLSELEKLDQAADPSASPEQQAALNVRRADLLKKIAEAAGGPQDRSMWMRQLADMVSAAVQTGTFPDGVKRLDALLQELEGRESDKDLAAYVKFRRLTAAYGLSLQTPKADFAKIQTQWLKDLGQYAADYPTCPDAAEAMLQIAIAQEFAGEEEKAKQWYARIVKQFPSTSAGKKAAGARVRLDSLGKSITLRGKSPDGKAVDLADYRGRVVLVQYWATWSDPAKRDMSTLKQLMTKYGRSFTVIGVSLDRSRKDLVGYLTKDQLPWPQIFEEGGLDSDPANQLGILSLPTMILVDSRGKVVNRNIQAAELESELKKLIR